MYAIPKLYRTILIFAKLNFVYLELELCSQRNDATCIYEWEQVKSLLKDPQRPAIRANTFKIKHMFSNIYIYKDTMDTILII